jgi:hypothetical protein
LKIKEIERKKKQDEKERQKELLKQEILKEMEGEKRKAELEAKLGVKTSSKSKEDGENEDDGNEEEEKEEPEIKFKPKLKLKDIEPKGKSSTLPPLEPNNAPSFSQSSMDLGLFFAFLKEVVKNDILIIKSDQGRMVIKDLDLDEDKIRVKVAQV